MADASTSTWHHIAIGDHGSVPVTVVKDWGHENPGGLSPARRRRDASALLGEAGGLRAAGGAIKGVPRDRHIVAREFLRALRDAETIIERCATLREKIRQAGENERQSFTVEVEGEGTVAVIWRPNARTLVEVKIDWRETLADAR